MTTITRPYLRADAREAQLLDAAARLFARKGFAGLTMVALADEAGVSRRLVYNHFPDLATLYDAFFDDRAARYLGSIDRAVADAGGDMAEAFSGAFRNLTAIPEADQRVIRLLVADPGLPELEALRNRLRRRIEARWLPTLTAGRIDDAAARGLLWTLVSGLLGLADLVSRGEISADAAVRLATALVVEVPDVVAQALPRQSKR
ncbi:MAG: TetR/AcrR family transcriptional regulator [Acidimicrobiia bacterium]